MRKIVFDIETSNDFLDAGFADMTRLDLYRFLSFTIMKQINIQVSPKKH